MPYVWFQKFVWLWWRFEILFFLTSWTHSILLCKYGIIVFWYWCTNFLKDYLPCCLFTSFFFGLVGWGRGVTDILSSKWIGFFISIYIQSLLIMSSCHILTQWPEPPFNFIDERCIRYLSTFIRSLFFCFYISCKPVCFCSLQVFWFYPLYVFSIVLSIFW